MSTYLWGIGNQFYLNLSKYKELLLDEIDAFIDSDVGKQDTICFGKRIFNPLKLDISEDDVVIVSSTAFYDDIAKHCSEEYGLSHFQDGSGGYLSLDEFIANKIINADWLPQYIGVDASTACQLDCSACYMRTNNNGILSTGHLKFANYKQLIDDNSQIRYVELSNNGEIFLNPEIKQIIEYSYLKNIELYANNGVNFNYVSDDVLETLVTCQFRELQISLDGASQEVYSKYRRGGDFNKVIENIKKVNRWKYKYNSVFPKMHWQFVVMNHNQTDVAEAKYMANELGMDIKFKHTWEDGFVPQNPEFLKSVTGCDFARKGNTNNDVVVFGNALCRQLFLEPRINWDGRLIGCCVLFEETFDVNVFDIGLKEALRSPAVMAARRALAGKSVEDVDFPCKRCKYYIDVMKKKNYIKARDLI